MKKALLWMLLGGMTYYTIEGLWRLPVNGGWANIYMVLVGGLCFFILGSINQAPCFYNLSMRWQALLGTIVALVIELFSGCILNIIFQLDIWDYSQLPLNVMGQVCLLYGVLWFFLIPFAVWLEDRLNLLGTLWATYKGLPVDDTYIYDYTLASAYKELFTGKKYTS